MSSVTVEFRPFNGPIRQVRVTGDQWDGRACVISTDCSGTRLDYVGHLYDTTAAPGSLEYSRLAYAHPECLRPEERWQPAHSRCQPTATPAW